jgi:hypothetical protein
MIDRMDPMQHFIFRTGVICHGGFTSYFNVKS